MPDAAACANIGPRGVRRRRRMAAIPFAAAVALFAVLLQMDAPRSFRLVLVAPLWMAALGVLQAREKT